jgi:dolichyl-diphosphooligosaccharide--protein glycosyltransferase
MGSGQMGKWERLRGALGKVPGLLVRFRPRINATSLLEASSLALILALAILFRIMQLRYGAYFSTEADTTFQYRVADYVVRNGYSAWFTWNDTLSWYPYGRDIPRTSFPGLPFSAAFLYSLLSFLGLNIPLYDVCIFFPVLMACLTCIFMYFLGRDLGGRSAGLLASFLMAVSPAFILRTYLGFFDTENIGIFSTVAISLFFLRSIEREKPLSRRLLYSTAAGLSMAYFHASWGASKYAVGLLALFMAAILFFNLYERRHLLSYGVALGVSSIIAMMIPIHGIGFLYSAENVAAFGLLILLCVYEGVRGRVGGWRAVLISGGMLASLFIGVLILESRGLIPPLAYKFLSVLDPSQRAASPLFESVAEHKKATWTTFFENFGVSLPLALFGTYLALRRREEKLIYGSLLFLSALYFTGSLIRLVLILSIPVSLMGAYGLKELLSPFLARGPRQVERRLRRRRMGLSREMGLIFAAVIFASILPTVWGAASLSNSPMNIGVTVPVRLSRGYPQDWLQALVWMRDNLPEDSIVVAWWDYGYWIETFSNKRTLADGSTLNGEQIGRIGRIMMLNQSEALEILKGYNATHILVYYTFNPSNPSQEWPLGDNAKWYWMVRIGGLNLTEYVEEGRYTAKFYESTIYNLMKMSADPTHFKLVYKSENGWVLIYEIKY